MCSFALGREAVWTICQASWKCGIFVGMAFVVATCVAIGNDSVDHVEKPSKKAGQSTTISRGFAIIDGAYVPPPYVVEQIDGEVFVNGHVVALLQRDCTLVDSTISPSGEHVRDKSAKPHRRRKKAAASGRKTARQANNRAENQQRNEIRRELKRDSILIAFGNDCVRFFAMRQAIDILAVLLSDAPAAEKRAAFEDERQFGQLSTLQWAMIVDRFRPTDELKRRMRPLVTTVNAELAVGESVSENALWYGILSSKSMRYGVTLTAMILAVIATGNLLLYRPQGRGRWSDINGNSDDALDVRRIVIILALLGAFDLLLTLAAQQTGAFLELNPLGSHLITNPIMLATFKLTSMAIAIGILLRLRRYRGAQVASWWLCLLCTILTFRWVTFNSLFFS